jgi:hypothetical protein
MLEAGKVYKDRKDREVFIVGRIKDYSEVSPYVWSSRGDWYDEQTGRFVFASVGCGRWLCLRPTWRCIVDHNAIGTESVNA